MNATESHGLRRFAVRVYRRCHANYLGLAYILRHPQELARHPQWIRQRTAATMALRMPWWPYDAVTWVAAHLPPQARVFEYGGGGSTLWLQDRGAAVTAVEHDKQWHWQLAEQFPTGRELLFRPPGTSGTVTSAMAPGFFDAYVAAIDDQPDGSQDLVIVDGRARVESVRHAMPKVKPGGLLLLDDTDRASYQPAIDMLGAWECHVFTGLKPGHRGPTQTSVWRRPASG
jgi:Methyltransferase domain